MTGDRFAPITTNEWHRRRAASRTRGAQSFDDLVGEGEDLVWHSFAKRPRGFEVDHQVDLAHLHDWQVARLLSLKDATSILADLLISVRKAWPVTQEPAGLGELSHEVDRCRSLSVAEVMALFNHVLESAKIGVRKPDSRIYLMMTEALGVHPKNCVYLDDLGVNLKPAREMGMITIKGINAAQAITELEAATKLSLR